MTRWAGPGLLLLGDAAHPMSPIEGQGLNVAVRDAVVAANHLCPELLRGAAPEALDQAAERVARERMPEIGAIQEHPDRQARTCLQPTVSGRLAMRLLPVLVRSGLMQRPLGARLRAFQHGVVKVNLTV